MFPLLVSGETNETSDFKSSKIWIMLFSYVLGFFKKGDTIQGGTLFKGGHYLRKYGYNGFWNYVFPVHDDITNLKHAYVSRYICCTDPY